jgi:NAD(P)H dehydrogenase (quinone)
MRSNHSTASGINTRGFDECERSTRSARRTTEQARFQLWASRPRSGLRTSRPGTDIGGNKLYAITGISGKVGGELARTLLDADQSNRAVVRNAGKGETWAALAEMEDAAALTAAFAGASAVFILPPSEFDPEPGYPGARKVIDAVVEALTAAKPDKVLCLSTVGADAVHDNLLSQRTMMEKALSALPLPVTFLRPGWFLENSAWDVASARETGVIASFLMPLDKTFPMVAAKDVGRVAAKLIQEEWSGTRVVELEGPRRVSSNDLAAAFANALGKPVRAEAVPPETWKPCVARRG